MFEFFAIFTNAYHAVVDWIFDPLWWWYAVGILLWFAALFVCVVVGWFFPSLRPTMGKLLFVLTVGIAAFLWGAQKMRNVDNEREAAREARRRPQQPTGGGWFDWMQQ